MSNHSLPGLSAAAFVAATVHDMVAAPPPTIAKGVGRAICIPDPQWQIRVLVKDAFG
jgi:hypothetical protein